MFGQIKGIEMACNIRERPESGTSQIREKYQSQIPGETRAMH